MNCTIRKNYYFLLLLALGPFLSSAQSHIWVSNPHTLFCEKVVSDLAEFYQSISERQQQCQLVNLNRDEYYILCYRHATILGLTPKACQRAAFHYHTREQKWWVEVWEVLLDTIGFGTEDWK